MNLELFFNVVNLIFAFGSNNWLSSVISFIIFCYNIYLKIGRRNLLSLVIDNQKENRSAGNRVGNIFKIKFIIYTLISMYGLCFAIMHFFDDTEFADKFKIFQENKEEY